jgi:hypothetical protein
MLERLVLRDVLRGWITSSFGPLMQVVAFMNTTGSDGIGWPASFAWSL